MNLVDIFPMGNKSKNNLEIYKMKMRLTLFVGGDNFNSKLCKQNLNHHNFNLDDEF